MTPSLGELLGPARVVDLTHPLTPEFPLFPVYDPVRVAEKFTLARDGFCMTPGRSTSTRARTSTRRPTRILALLA